MTDKAEEPTRSQSVKLRGTVLNTLERKGTYMARIIKVREEIRARISHLFVNSPSLKREASSERQFKAFASLMQIMPAKKTVMALAKSAVFS